mmetsp:Transcript_4614/g.13140  ORF Transcript_4614/g.13140 Transcript_4614/m.13140 type:complete len:240 (+) Transcript_4614:643-1362(+)
MRASPWERSCAVDTSRSCARSRSTSRARTSRSRSRRSRAARVLSSCSPRSARSSASSRSRSWRPSSAASARDSACVRRCSRCIVRLSNWFLYVSQSLATAAYLRSAERSPSLASSHLALARAHSSRSDLYSASRSLSVLAMLVRTSLTSACASVAYSSSFSRRRSAWRSSSRRDCASSARARSRSNSASSTFPLHSWRSRASSLSLAVKSSICRSSDVMTCSMPSASPRTDSSSRLASR